MRVSNEFISNLKLWRKGNLLKIKWSLIRLGLETRLEQVVDGIK
jgi:hypothetical protein